jgi:WXXGXW repeat (2 copies)
MTKSAAWNVWIAAGLALLAGCYGHVRPRGAWVVYQPPPPPAASVAIGASPYAQGVFVDGHYEWDGAQYVWIDGYWVPGRAGYSFVQPRWERRSAGYVYVPGGYADSRGVVVASPPGRGVRVTPPNRISVSPPQVRRPAGAAFVRPPASRGVTVTAPPVRSNVTVRPPGVRVAPPSVRVRR